MIALEPHAEGTILPIRARPGGRRNGIDGQQDGMLKVSVTQAPEKGKANKALVEVLAKGLSLRKSQIEILSGGDRVSQAISRPRDRARRTSPPHRGDSGEPVGPAVPARQLGYSVRGTQYAVPGTAYSVLGTLYYRLWPARVDHHRPVGYASA